MGKSWFENLKIDIKYNRSSRLPSKHWNFCKHNLSRCKEINSSLAKVWSVIRRNCSIFAVSLRKANTYPVYPPCPNKNTNNIFHSRNNNHSIARTSGRRSKKILLSDSRKLIFRCIHQNKLLNSRLKASALKPPHNINLYVKCPSQYSPTRNPKNNK